VLIFVLQASSAAFTPTFQATLPDLLPQEGDYTKALSLSRMAYDMESLVSPMLAAALLTVIGFHNLFVGTVAGFLASAALVVTVVLPAHPAPQRRSIYDQTTRGLRIYLATPRLRGLLAINAGVAAAGSMVFVNTVVIVQAGLDLSQSAVAWALASFGAGSMLAALALPRLLEKRPDRSVMLVGIGLMVAGTFAGTWLAGHASLMALWFVLGLGYSTAQTPSGRLLRRSANQEDRPALFAAQFALSHACWLLFYPLAGWLGVHYGMPVTFVMLGSAGALAAWVVLQVWPAQDPEVIEHEHPELPVGHEHTRGGVRHTHAFVVDDQHPSWPNLGG
jgi:predicted MFS family arabinose efflux permease